MSATASTILVPLDGSRFAEQSLPLALSIARATQRRIRLCHVRLMPLWPEEIVGPDTVDAMCRLLHSEGETYLREVQQRFQTPDVPIETAVIPGDIVSAAEAISDHVQERPVELVVMATHGLGGVRRAWLGSVADHLIRHLTIPVLLVHPGAELPNGDQRILVPLDGSVLAEQALDEACALAKAMDREIVLFRVVTPVMNTVPSLEAPYVNIDGKLTDSLRAAAEDYLDRIEEQVTARGIRCVGMTMVGPSVAEWLIDIARPAHFSLVVMTTHGRGGMKRMILGSVADKVARGASVPVMVLRPWPTRTSERVQRVAAVDAAAQVMAV